MSNEVTYKQDLPQHCQISPSFHVLCLKPVKSGPLAMKVHSTKPPAPLVQGFIKSMLNEGTLEFVIYWEGYGSESTPNATSYMATTQNIYNPTHHSHVHSQKSSNFVVLVLLHLFDQGPCTWYTLTLIH